MTTPGRQKTRHKLQNQFLDLCHKLCHKLSIIFFTFVYQQM